jgi:hypothetical protein
MSASAHESRVNEHLAMEYWRWLIRGSGGRAGITRFRDRWLLLHGFVGVVFASIDQIVLKEAANSVLLPLAGIFIGLCFAWGGNAQALLQTDELEEVGEHHPGGFSEYLYVYQSAILLILVTLIAWGIAGLGVFDSLWPRCVDGWLYRCVRGLLFVLASMTLRECWHVVLGAQSMLLVRREIRRRRRGD